ncbi:protein ENL-like isoform X1 [Leptidea sinapis]|uniref:protein ENL-like isoform X1 n=1 Tax=Leptidea sinapis TaxID=189913 RepID=UPI0021C2E7F6|nr:protein ENL-like isoform X1 [Leptidea sinapis]
MLMVQTNSQPMKTTKIKGPPPVPPRPSQSMVAEALAKTRKAVADSKASLIKTRTYTKQESHHVSSKAKTLDRTSATTKPSVLPRQNGLARVKSFIRDVISDRSSSDEKKSSGGNSRRSSSDSSSIHSPSSAKKSNESLNSRAVKTCKQILVRSLSTSNKLDLDSKCKVSKSSSFAEKTLPLRKAPPPPLSPKPKIKPLKQAPLQNSSLPKRPPKPPEPEVDPYSLPVDAKTTENPVQEAPYATVDEVIQIENRLEPIPVQDNNIDNKKDVNDNTEDESVNTNNNSLERKTSRVTEMLISEILASRSNNNDEVNTVIDKGKDSPKLADCCSTDMEIMKDMNNHEMLIYELQSMRSQSNVPDGLSDQEALEKMDNYDSDCEQNYAMSSASHTGEDLDQSYAYIADTDLKSRLRKQFRAISTMSLHGLPPLPKSLSGFADGEPAEEANSRGADESRPPPTDLDGQLTYLKKEMASLRQLDLSLLSELWSLSEAMATWRRQLERSPRLRPAPPPPPPPTAHYLAT